MARMRLTDNVNRDNVAQVNSVETCKFIRRSRGTRTPITVQTEAGVSKF